MIERAAILSKGDRLRLDLALVTTATRRTASLPGAANGERPRIMKCKDLEQMQRDNIIAALRVYPRENLWTERRRRDPSVNPSPLAARMRSFGIKRDRNRF
jgi:hypothetical protein